MKNRIMNYQRHNGKWCVGTCIGLKYKHELNSKTENAQRIKYQTQKNYMTPKQETTNSIKVLQEVMTIMEKQDLRQNLYGFKKENTQTYDRQKN